MTSINWYAEKLKTKKEIKREMFNQLYEEFKTKNIVIVGLRQIGKSTLAEQIALKYYEENNVDNRDISEYILYLNINLLQPKYRADFTNYLKSSLDEIKPQIVILDEIQRIPEWSNIMQGLIDFNVNIKYIMTGSNTFSLTQEIALGRFKVFNLNPLSFSEAKCFWKNISFEDYLFFGSFPKHDRYSNIQEQYMDIVEDQVIGKVLLQDSETQIKKDKFYTLLKKIKNYIGNELNSSDMLQTSELSRPTAKEYMKIMQLSKLIQYVPKYGDLNHYQKVKVYLNDKSMITYLNEYENMNENDYGSLIENLVFNHLDTLFNYKFMSSNIFYYKNTKEIDFIIPKEKAFIEVKYRKNNIDWEQITRSMNNSIEDPLQGYKKIIVSKDENLNINGWHIIPLVKFLELKNFNF